MQIEYIIGLLGMFALGYQVGSAMEKLSIRRNVQEIVLGIFDAMQNDMSPKE